MVKILNYYVSKDSSQEFSFWHDDDTFRVVFYNWTAPRCGQDNKSAETETDGLSLDCK